MPTEQESADLAKRRGQAAAQISDPDKRRKFIAAQGEYEANKDKSPLSKVTSLMTPSKLESETQAVEASKGTKGLESYKKGGIVKETGPAYMHKGERVLTKDDPMNKMMGLAEGPMAHPAKEEPKKKSKKEVKSVHVRKAHKGGFIAENHHVSPEHPMEEHALPDMQSLQQHMSESLGAGSPESATQEPEPTQGQE